MGRTSPEAEKMLYFNEVGFCQETAVGGIFTPTVRVFRLRPTAAITSTRNSHSNSNPNPNERPAWLVCRGVVVLWKGSSNLREL